ncbi:MAG: glycosyltransferase family 39 protein [Candidatus Andersenbacteria bacterium]|nr:glycosyltransferase family 39 protein [Candidatus Andersenbacteria bacterium]
MNRRQAMLVLFLTIVLGVGLRSYHLTARSLWFDEAFSWRLIQFPFAEMIARDAADVHPPLFYVLLKGWSVVFGTSLKAMRLFSVTAAAGSIAAIYLFTSSAWTLARHKESLARARAIGLTAALFLTLSGWQIAFAWEARMYTLGTLFVLLSSWLLLKAIRQKKQQPGLWLAYGLLAAAGIYTHYYVLFSLAAQVLFIIAVLLIQTRGRLGEFIQSRLAWYAALSGLVIALAFAPWLPTFLRQNSQVQAQFWIPAINRWSVPATLYRLVLPTVEAPPHSGVKLIGTTALLTVVILAGIWLVPGARTDSKISFLKKAASSLDAAWLTLLMAVIPFIASISLSLIGQSLYQDRYFVFAQPFLLVAVAVCIFRLRPTWLRRLLITLVSLLLASGFFIYWRQLNILAKPGSHAATAYAFTHRTADEPVYSSSSFVFFSVAHYAQEEFKNTTVPKLYSQTGELLHFAGGPILKTEDIIGSQVFTNPATKSFWLIETTGFGSSELKVPDTFIRTDHQVFPELYGYQGDVIANHYQRR